MAEKKGKRKAKPIQRKAPVKPPRAGPRARPGEEQSGPVPGFVVGIGASAGGLEPLKKFFQALPADSGLTFVVLQHQDPAAGRLLSELLAKYAPIKVKELNTPAAVEADCVYVVPPGKSAIAEGPHLRPVELSEPRRLRTPIDDFFRSLAENRKDKAIGIILSGAGSEGTLGLKAIKGHGGLAIVQDPSTADHDSMPRSALSTGMIDFVLPAEQMAAALVRFTRHPLVQAPAEAAEHASPVVQHLPEILALVRGKTGCDFSGYKKSTVVRRVERRMGLAHLASPPDYVKLLREHPAEIARLQQDLLISVTSFFREPASWVALAKEVIAPMAQAQPPEQPIRAWAPGCATGEEAYSLAIVLLEQLGLYQRPGGIQLFATDLDEEALKTARTGIYPVSIAADVSPERLRGYFTKVGNDFYQVNKPVREHIVFAAQNVLKDPPFCRLDLISCRNLFIYLEAELQRKLLTMFNFCLKPERYLFLGGSETIGREDDLFETLNKKWHIYRRIDTGRPAQLHFPVAMAPRKPSETGASGTRLAAANLAALTEQIVLKEFAPAAVVVNRKLEVQLFHGPSHRYLTIPPGSPTAELAPLLPEGLRGKLRASLQEAARGNRRITIHNARVLRDHKESAVSIVIQPMAGPPLEENLYLIVFIDGPTAAEADGPAAGPADGDEALVRRLEYALEVTRADLQSSIKELEDSAEQLRVSNEEILSVNEELQSTNEELETSKEELQSLNEELNTVNSQLQDKVEELEIANTYLSNLLSSTEIATVFLDADMRIKRFTASIAALMKLIPGDIGRPFSDIAKRFSDIGLVSDCAAVLARGEAITQEIRTEEGRWFLRRVLPYRALDTKIDGIVMTFTEITPLKQTLEQLQEQATRHAVLADLGLGGLREPEPQALMEKATRAVRQALAVDFVDVQHVEPDGAVCRMVAGDGFKFPVPPQAAVDPSYLGFVLAQREPVVVEDADAERRVAVPPFFREHAIASWLSVVILGIDKPYGVLTAYSKSPRHFGKNDIHFLQTVANVLAEALERHGREQRLRSLNESLEQRTAERTQLARLMRDVAVAANEAESIAEAIQYTLRRVCESRDWPIGHYYRVGAGQAGAGQAGAPAILVATEHWYADPKKDHGPLRTALRQARFVAGEAMVGKAFQDAAPVWVPDLTSRGELPFLKEAGDAGLRCAIAFPVLVGKEAVGVLEFFAPQIKEPDPGLLEAMASVGTQIGRVIERHRLQEQLTDALWLEQRRFGQELHDTVGQELTGISMMARSLERKLKEGKSEQGGAAATEIAHALQTVVLHTHDLSKGLFPGDIKVSELRSALRDLAAKIQERHEIRCTLEHDPQAVIADDKVAMQLFLVAREAVTNAVKHARAERIEIGLHKEGAAVVLRVRDDGDGISPQTQQTKKGLGMTIMRHRAAVIGATFDVAPGPTGGTVVTCALQTRAET